MHLFWLIGIGLRGNSLYFNLPYRRWYFLLKSTLFGLFHCMHTDIIYYRTYLLTDH